MHYHLIGICGTAMASLAGMLQARGHKVIPRALLVPQNDPTTLFTGSGMQPLIPYLLGEPHQDGIRLVDSQTCLRAGDIEEVGDNRHTTFFEMLGNWSLGDYFKKEEVQWLFEFLVDVVGLDPQKLRQAGRGGYQTQRVVGGRPLLCAGSFGPRRRVHQAQTARRSGPACGSGLRT